MGIHNKIAKKEGNNFFYETTSNFRGEEVRRLKSSLFYLLAIGSIILGIIFILMRVPVGAMLLFTVAPCLLIYPIVRFFFGGKDSLAALVVTIVVEEALKQKIVNKLEGKKNRKR